MGGQAFHGEGAAHAHGLVVERFGIGVAGNGGVYLFAAHAFVDVRVVGDGFERDVSHALVDEPFADVLAGGVGWGQFAG